jgi:hypothetical protein
MASSAPSRYDHTEGTVARSIEQQTARLPSDTFLWAAGASIAASATLQALGKRHASVFVGQWAPTLLILGLYNKLVKQLGSDSLDRHAEAYGGNATVRPTVALPYAAKQSAQTPAKSRSGGGA